MRLDSWLNKRVLIIIQNGFSYFGIVSSCDADSLILIDKRGQRVQLRDSEILTIKEVNL